MGDEVSLYEGHLDVDVQSTGNLVVTIWAEQYQANLSIDQSHGYTVANNGPQSIPIGHSYPPGDYLVVVRATDNVNTTIEASATITVP